VRGKPLRTTNVTAVKTMLRRLLNVMTAHSWPMPEVIASSQKQRMLRLTEILNASK